jgi:hypothetical protein
MLKRLLVGFLLLAVTFATVVWLQPDGYRITRSAVIAAPAAAVFPHVNDLRRWQDWSPWARLDPAATVTFAGPQAGVGASLRWDDNDKVGAGTVTITESKPNERIATRTDFVKPFAGTGYSDFIFSQTGGQTNVIWTMTGAHNFVGKAIYLVRGMEATLGSAFENGLARLKLVSERR